MLWHGIYYPISKFILFLNTCECYRYFMWFYVTGIAGPRWDGSTKIYKVLYIPLSELSLNFNFFFLLWNVGLIQNHIWPQCQVATTEFETFFLWRSLTLADGRTMWTSITSTYFDSRDKRGRSLSRRTVSTPGHGMYPNWQQFWKSFEKSLRTLLPKPANQIPSWSVLMKSGSIHTLASGYSSNLKTLREKWLGIKRTELLILCRFAHLFFFMTHSRKQRLFTASSHKARTPYSLSLSTDSTQVHCNRTSTV